MKAAFECCVNPYWPDQSNYPDLFRNPQLTKCDPVVSVILSNWGISIFMVSPILLGTLFWWTDIHFGYNTFWNFLTSNCEGESWVFSWKTLTLNFRTSNPPSPYTHTHTHTGIRLLTENFEFGFENLKAPRALENEDFLWTRWNSDLAWMIYWCETILNPRLGVPR